VPLFHGAIESKVTEAYEASPLQCDNDAPRSCPIRERVEERYRIRAMSLRITDIRTGLRTPAEIVSRASSDLYRHPLLYRRRVFYFAAESKEESASRERLWNIPLAVQREGTLLTAGKPR